MWLPKDERKLLRGYYHLIGEINQPRSYRKDDLCELLADHRKIHLIHEYGAGLEVPSNSVNMETDMPGFKAEVKLFQSKQARRERANQSLVARQMITLQDHENESGVVLLGLTLCGCDLGRRYASVWERTGLWFESHQHHWIMLVFSFVGGVAGGLFISWLT